MQEESEEDDIIIGESSEYSRKAEFKKPLLVQEAMQKVAIARGKEMRPGYINTSKSSDGTINQVTVPDSRQEYVNSVKYLSFLLAPEIMDDENVIKKKGLKCKSVGEKFKSFKDRETDLFKKCCYTELKAEKEDNKIKMTKTEYSFIPAMDAVIETEKYNMDSGEFIISKGYWNNKVSFYWESMIKLCDELLEELNLMIHRLDYFKGEEQW